ncbi:hypothetical protein WG68_08685 [Arsukibacterium ikkense]|uniref:Uncharacterized protein n=1 Tax=Arsukibacterium ikkense TaxID=336831 RepID=A0A0M2V4K7_9GAMM|nr:hypothetical protein [Arsukibacterium ikkense]KKO45782.1 hypothetical protein WG68_08685 [Arsukibacterium ikkense]
MENIETILSWFTPESYAKSKELTLCQYFGCLRTRRDFLIYINDSQKNPSFNLEACKESFILKVKKNGVLTWPLSEKELDSELELFRNYSVRKSTGKAINDDEMNSYTISISAYFLDRKQLIEELVAYVDRYIVPNLQPDGIRKLPDVSSVLRELHEARALQFLDLLIFEKLFLKKKLSVEKKLGIIFSDSKLDLQTVYHRFKQTHLKTFKEHVGYFDGTANKYGFLLEAARQQFVNPNIANARIFP